MPRWRLRNHCPCSLIAWSSLRCFSPLAAVTMCLMSISASSDASKHTSNSSISIQAFTPVEVLHHSRSNCSVACQRPMVASIYHSTTAILLVFRFLSPQRALNGRLHVLLCRGRHERPSECWPCFFTCALAKLVFLTFRKKKKKTLRVFLEREGLRLHKFTIRNDTLTYHIHKPRRAQKEAQQANTPEKPNEPPTLSNSAVGQSSSKTWPDTRSKHLLLILTLSPSLHLSFPTLTSSCLASSLSLSISASPSSTFSRSQLMRSSIFLQLTAVFF